MSNRPTAVFPLCAHIKADGDQCGSPALRGMRFCFQHLGGTTSSLLRARSTTVNNADLDLVYPADRESIQHNLDLVARALAEDRIDTSIANTYIRLYRVCEQNLHRWEKLHKGEKTMPSPPPAAAVSTSTDAASTETPNFPQPCHPEAEFVAEPTNEDEGSASKSSDGGPIAPAVEQQKAQPSAATTSQTDAPLTKEEIERRQEIIGRHQGRLDKLREEYKGYPNLTEILTSAIWDILREEGEHIPPGTRYA